MFNRLNYFSIRLLLQLKYPGDLSLGIGRLRAIVLILHTALFTLSVNAVRAQNDSIQPNLEVEKRVHFEIPDPKGFVNDFEDLFTSAEEKRLTRKIKKIKRSTGAEIAVVTIRNIDVDKNQFDDYTLALANDWGVGEKDKNNGILIGISKGHRKIRIQNGNGIVNRISDERTKEIIDQIFIPAFKIDRYLEGTMDGLDALKNVLEQ